MAFLITTRFAHECAHSSLTATPSMHSSRLEMKHCSAVSEFAVSRKARRYKPSISCLKRWQNLISDVLSCGLAGRWWIFRGDVMIGSAKVAVCAPLLNCDCGELPNKCSRPLWRRNLRVRSLLRLHREPLEIVVVLDSVLAKILDQQHARLDRPLDARRQP